MRLPLLPLEWAAWVKMDPKLFCVVVAVNDVDDWHSVAVVAVAVVVVVVEAMVDRRYSYDGSFHRIHRIFVVWP